VGATVRLLHGVVLVPVGIVRGRAALVDALQRVWFGAGQVSGLFGRRFDEYRVIHGR